MKWTAIALSLASTWREEFSFRFLCLAECEFSADRNVRVELEIELLDACEHKLGEFNRRKLALAEKLSYLFDGSESEIAVVHAQNIFS